MLKFENNNIVTGYIKQKLSTFELPKVNIVPKYLQADNTYKSYIVYSTESTAAKKINYLDGDSLVQYYKNNDNTITKKLLHQNYIATVTNNTARQLKIQGNIYDTYTHEYLGDYLRFYRDYYLVDLMSMYNCFSNKICNNLKISATEPNIIFDAKDSHYKIYAVPVKLFRKYTIAIDCSEPVEMCCGFYNKYLYNFNNNTNGSEHFLLKNTYAKLGTIKFNKPVLYTKLVDLYDAKNAQNYLPDYLLNEADLKLFIKIPANNTSSITILEGDYIGYNDTSVCVDKQEIVIDQAKKIVAKNENRQFLRNKYIINNEKADSYEIFKPISTLQLLQLNTQESYVFADRLIEYLIDNAISETDTLYENVERAQQVMAENSISTQFAGIWEKKMQAIFYEYMTNLKNIAIVDKATKKITGYSIALSLLANTKQADILGFIDKDVEKVYKSDRHTLMDINLHEME